ncbi:excalibur calcium-binding domain-containing protein [Streptomyces spiralis]
MGAETVRTPRACTRLLPGYRCRRRQRRQPQDEDRCRRQAAAGRDRHRDGDRHGNHPPGSRAHRDGHKNRPGEGHRHGASSIRRGLQQRLQRKQQRWRGQQRLLRQLLSCPRCGSHPLHAGDPGYSRKLDRDGDGVACE